MAAYRRRQAHSSNYHSAPSPPLSPASSLAANDIRASAEYGDPLLLSACEPSVASAHRVSSISYAEGPSPCEDVTNKKTDKSNEGFWSPLARKVKTILQDNDDEVQSHARSESETVEKFERARKGEYNNTYNSPESHLDMASSSVRKGLGPVASSINHIGGTIGNALEEGVMAMENRTSDIIQETHKIRMREKDNSMQKDQTSNISRLQKQSMMQSCITPQSQSQTHTDWEMQLKASRDVAMAMATKAKLLLRELKTVKADLGFAKERCRQLELENQIIRESFEEGGTLEDDDLVRLQLETLLAEKTRLAQENSVYARENRTLREMVEYHQLTMQAVVYLDEGSEQVTDVYSFKITSTGS